jgi:hypothetical protein
VKNWDCSYYSAGNHHHLPLKRQYPPRPHSGQSPRAKALHTEQIHHVQRNAMLFGHSSKSALVTWSNQKRAMVSNHLELRQKQNVIHCIWREEASEPPHNGKQAIIVTSRAVEDALQHIQLKVNLHNSKATVLYYRAIQIHTVSWIKIPESGQDSRLRLYNPFWLSLEYA